MTLYFRVAGVDPVDARDPDDGTLRNSAMCCGLPGRGARHGAGPIAGAQPNRAVMEINGSYPPCGRSGTRRLPIGTATRSTTARGAYA
jgi:hypothetical protein